MPVFSTRKPSIRVAAVAAALTAAAAALTLTGCSSSASPAPAPTPSLSTQGASSAATEYVISFAEASNQVFVAADAAARSNVDPEGQLTIVSIAVTAQEAVQAANAWLAANGIEFTPSPAPSVSYANANQARAAIDEALAGWAEVANQAQPTADVVMDEVIASVSEASVAYRDALNNTAG